MVECNSPAMPSITLRPYQQTCVERAIAVFQRKAKGGRAYMLRKFHIPVTPSMTCGEAADLIGKALEDRR